MVEIEEPKSELFSKQCSSSAQYSFALGVTETVALFSGAFMVLAFSLSDALFRKQLSAGLLSIYERLFNVVSVSMALCILNPVAFHYWADSICILINPRNYWQGKRRVPLFVYVVYAVIFAIGLNYVLANLSALRGSLY